MTDTGKKQVAAGAPDQKPREGERFGVPFDVAIGLRARYLTEHRAGFAPVFGEQGEHHTCEAGVRGGVRAEQQFFDGASRFGGELERFLAPAGGLIADGVGARGVAGEQALGRRDRSDFDRALRFGFFTDG